MKKFDVGKYYKSSFDVTYFCERRTKYFVVLKELPADTYRKYRRAFWVDPKIKNCEYVKLTAEKTLWADEETDK